MPRKAATKATTKTAATRATKAAPRKTKAAATTRTTKAATARTTKAATARTTKAAAPRAAAKTTRAKAAPAASAAKAKTAAAPATKRKKRLPVIVSPYTKPELYAAISDNTGLAKRDVTIVFEELTNLIERHVRKRGAGVFTLPGILKIHAVKKPATRERIGFNPQTREKIQISRKPSRMVVKIRPLKRLKEMVE